MLRWLFGKKQRQLLPSAVIFRPCTGPLEKLPILDQTETAFLLGESKEVAGIKKICFYPHDCFIGYHDGKELEDLLKRLPARLPFCKEWVLRDDKRILEVLTS
ncbi:MAG: hypothetical protein Q8P45_01650 [Candidatus Harrisonbacteria bacterium]|nr:hypothetical protein [Candidatus Harrisonbacteria bacterium]